MSAERGVPEIVTELQDCDSSYSPSVAERNGKLSFRRFRKNKLKAKVGQPFWPSFELTAKGRKQRSNQGVSKSRGFKPDSGMDKGNPESVRFDWRPFSVSFQFCGQDSTLVLFECEKF